MSILEVFTQPPASVNTASSLPLMHHMQGIELEVVALIEPGADKVIEPEAGAPRERQGIDHELGDGLVPDRVRLVVEDVDAAVPDLHKIDVAGQRGLGQER